MNSVDGVWGFVYAGETGLGVGGLHVKNGTFHGADSGGVKYAGTITPDAHTGELNIDATMDVPAGTWLVGGASAQDVPMQRTQSFKVPANFGDMQPLKLPIRPGMVWVIFKRCQDELASFCDGLVISPTNSPRTPS